MIDNNKNQLSTDGGDDRNTLHNYNELGDFTSWSCSDGKEIYQKVFSMSKNLSFCLLALIKHIIIGLLSYCLSRCRRRRLAKTKTNKIMQAYLPKAKLILLNNRGDFSNINRSCGE